MAHAWQRQREDSCPQTLADVPGRKQAMTPVNPDEAVLNCRIMTRFLAAIMASLQWVVERMEPLGGECHGPADNGTKYREHWETPKPTIESSSGLTQVHCAPSSVRPLHEIADKIVTTNLIPTSSRRRPYTRFPFTGSLGPNL